jgi:hypothetical protein
MSDVKETIRLGGEAGDDLPAMLPRRQIRIDDLTYEVPPGGLPNIRIAHEAPHTHENSDRAI